jgi:hypothetical protein
MRRFHRLASLAAVVCAATLVVGSNPAWADPASTPSPNTSPTTVSETTGVITGTIAPNVWLRLDLSHTTRWDYRHYEIQADSTGAFTLNGIEPGDYVAWFMVPGTTTCQYVPQTTDQSEATIFTVVAGGVTIVNDTALPTGTISGRVFLPDGSPAANANVSASGPGAGWATTATDGGYRMSVVVGDYRLWIGFGMRSQYYHQTLSWENATLVSVLAGQDVVADDTLLPVGAVAVTATDSVTGTAIPDFCVDVNSQRACSNGTGIATISDLAVGGNYYIQGSHSGYLMSDNLPITIVAGQMTKAALVLTPESYIETTALDAATKQPVADVCIAALAAPGGTMMSSPGQCTDEAGKIRISYVAAGTYSLYAEPRDGVHGAQWVGAAGGTGDRDAAARITVGVGQTVQAPVIYLDGAGKITGTVTDAASGAPLGACVATIAMDAYHPRAGDCPGAYSDASGKYTLDGLGPYQWPVQFAASGHGWQWSGNAANRAHATPTTVTVGGTAVADAALSAGSTLRFSVVDSTGVPVPDRADVTVVSAETQEPVGIVAVPDGFITHVPPQPVRITYSGDNARGLWYQNSRDFDHATTVDVTDTSLNLTLVVPAG